MPNTLTNLKDIKVAQRALMPFTANLLPVTAFSTNFGPQQADKGDTVRVPLVGAPTGSSDFAGDYTANADSTVTTLPVTLNRHKFKTVHVTAREASETAMDVLDTLVETAAQQLAHGALDLFEPRCAAQGVVARRLKHRAAAGPPVGVVQVEARQLSLVYRSVGSTDHHAVAII